MGKYILKPTDKFVIYYSMIMAPMYAISFFIDSYTLSFDLYPILSPSAKTI